LRYGSGRLTPAVVLCHPRRRRLLRCGIAFRLLDQLAKGRVHAAPLQAAQRIRLALPHPLQRIHEILIRLGWLRAALIESEEPLRHQEHIRARLLPRFPSIALCAQALVSRWSTAVRRRTAASACAANRVCLAGIERQHLFEADVVLPEVTPVIFVLKSFAWPQ